MHDSSACTFLFGDVFVAVVVVAVVVVLAVVVVVLAVVVSMHIVLIFPGFVSSQ